jgi:hypothetical protein
MENWAWGLLLTAFTIAIHATGIGLIAIAARPIRDRLQGEGTGDALATTIGFIGGVGLLLAALHGFEAGIWAFAYLRLGALQTLHEAMLYSLDSLTTRGASGLVLEPSWQMLGAIEAADGMLLFGISTAFIFAVMQMYGPVIRRHPKSHDA